MSHLVVSYVGVDLDGRVLREARSRLGANAGVSFVRGEANCLPFRDACLSAVVMIRVYHRISDASAMLAGVVRTLKPGGKLVLAVMPRPSLTTLAYDLWGGLSRPGRRSSLTFSPGNRVEVTPGRNPGFVETLRLTHARLNEAGFRVVQELGCGFEELPLLRALPTALWVRLAEAFREPVFFPTVVIVAERVA